MELNLNSIKEMMKEGKYTNALDDLVYLINDDNFSLIPVLLDGISEIQNLGYDLSEEQLEKIKPYIDDFNENIQDSATDIYLKAISRKFNAFKEESHLIISKLDRFETGVRDKITDFIIELFFDSIDHEKHLLKGLISRVKDDFWSIRMKVLELLNKIFTIRPNFIKDFEAELDVIYDEKDIDVVREGLDFLSRLYIKTYTSEDLKNLIISVDEREWLAQEKILMLITKLGIVRPELIPPVAPELIKLLDHHDYLVTKAVVNVIEEIIDYHTDVFDSALFSAISSENIDNMEAVEGILRISVIKNGFSRFFILFNKFDIKSDLCVKSFSNIIKQLNNFNSKMVKSFISDLILELLKNLTKPNYKRIKEIFRNNNQESIITTAFQSLSEFDLTFNPLFEERRKKLIKFLLTKLPDLNFLKLRKWLDMKLLEGYVSIDDLQAKFHIDSSKIIDFVNNLVSEGKLFAEIKDHYIVLKAEDVKMDNDLLFLKQWKVNQKSETADVEIKLFVQIRNISGVDIQNLNIGLEYPKDQFSVESEEQETTSEILKPKENVIIKYNLQKKESININPKTTSINVIFSYQKEGKLYRVNKKLDILLV